MKLFRWVLSPLAFSAFVILASSAEAQTVTVEGSVQYSPHGQPYGAPHPPPGYGYGQPTYGQPAYGPTYVQPAYGQPGYAPVPAPRVRQVRYEDRETSVKGLWIPGAVLFGVSYGLTVAFGTLSWDDDYVTGSLIPLVGPWMMLAYANNDDEAAGAVLSGVAQLAGATMFVLGLVLKQTVKVAVYSLDESDERAPQLALDVLPALGGGMVGVTLTHF